MSSLIFDGRAYSDATILPTLRDAAHDNVPTTDRNMIMNPREWVSPFVYALKQSPLQASLAAAIEALIASSDDREVALGAWIQSSTEASRDFASIADALVRQAQAGRLETAGLLVSALNGAPASSGWHPDDRIRKLALEPRMLPIREQLMLLLGTHDLAWVVAHAAELLGENPDDALVLAAYAATPLSGAALQTFIGDLRASLDRAGSSVGAAVEAGLRQINR